MQSLMLASASATRPSSSQPPSALDTILDRSFRGLTCACAWLRVYLLWRVGRQAAPARQKYGRPWLTSTPWDVNKGQCGPGLLSDALVLTIMRLPTVSALARDVFKAVPPTRRVAIGMGATRWKEAAMGMGCTRSQMVWRVVLPTALPSMLTGVMLAVARASGETAPLLFTALFSNYWVVQDGAPALMAPTASLAVLIYNFSGMPFENQIEMAWTAALILVLLVLVINITGQVLSRRRV